MYKLISSTNPAIPLNDVFVGIEKGNILTFYDGTVVEISEVFRSDSSDVVLAEAKDCHLTFIVE